MGGLSKASMAALRSAAAITPPGRLHPGGRRPTHEATISINGGPEVPLGLVKQVLAVVKGRGARERTAAANRDLGEEAGVAPEQEKHEAEVGGIAADRLRSIVERVERLEEDRKALGDDIKDIFSEAKSAGFDVKVLRQVIRLRKLDPAEVEEQETLLDLYRRALGC